MKKTILAAFSALVLLAPTTMRADEPAKEYNMVITLQNGTTITLGHNDIKNITFNGEEISISGNAANTIEQLGDQTMENRARIEAIYGSLDELRMIINDQDNNMLGHIVSLEGQTDILTTEIKDLRDYVSYLMTKIEELQDRSVANDIRITTLDEAISQMRSRDDYLENNIYTLQSQIEMLNAIVNDLNKKLEEK